MSSNPSFISPPSVLSIALDNTPVQELSDATEPLASRTEMVPPPHTTMFAPPPPSTFTLKQLLAYPIQLPASPSGPIVAALAAKTKRPTHNSSAASMKYDAILDHSLRKIPALVIDRFRTRIAAMDSVRFDHPISLPWDASPMLSEGSVTGYLDAQVLIAAWQAVLQMLPLDREYDLQMAKQIAVVDGIPDQTYSLLTRDKCHHIAVIELKSIGVVKGMLSVIDHAERRVMTAPSDDWTAVTRQVRMYAASSKIRDVLVMDETVGIYFRFPGDPACVDDSHDYTWGSSELGSVYGDEPRLSLRELVVFFLLAALDRNNVELRDFAGEALSAIPIPAIRQYRNVLPPPPESKKRPGSARQSERSERKRGKRHASGPQETFDGWVLGSEISFEFIPERAPLRQTAHHVRGSSLDSGFHDSTSPDNSPPKIRLREPAPVASLTVERLLKTNVALVTDGTTKFVAKLFCWSSSKTDPEESLQRELDVFSKCASLQGIHIPYLHGVCRIIDPPPRYYCLVMLTEYIGSGITVDALVDIALELADEGEFARCEKHLSRLRASAKLAVHSLHKLQVVHADLAGRNMVVHEDHVVLVDFGCSKVGYEELVAFNLWKDQDMMRLESVFAVEW